MDQITLFSTDWIEQAIKDTRRGIMSFKALDPIFTWEEWHGQTQEIQHRAGLMAAHCDDEFQCEGIVGLWAETDYDIGLSGLIQLRNEIEYWCEMSLWCDADEVERYYWDFIEDRLVHCWSLIRGSLEKLPPIATVHNMGTIDGVVKDIVDTYKDTSFDSPWKMGISWGKDSTEMLKLTVEALDKIPASEWERPIYVVTSDTKMEIAPNLRIIRKNMKDFQSFIEKTGMPFEMRLVEPNLNERYFTNLIGKGYLPQKGGPVAKWCTSRLKLQPSARVTKEFIADFEKVIAVVGTRYDESASRARSIDKWAGESRYGYSSIPGEITYAPIVHLTTAQVWEDLQEGLPWGSYDNYLMLKELYEASSFQEEYEGTNPESILVGGRMGCAVCFVVSKDKTLLNLINNGYSWLSPLLDFRELVKQTEANPFYREATPIDRKTALPSTRRARNPEKVTMGGFNQRGRELLLSGLLEAQDRINTGMATAGFEIEGGYELISPEEIHWIKSWWNHLVGYEETGFTPALVVNKPVELQAALF